MSLSPLDPSSFSRPELCRVENIHLDLDVDFTSNTLCGSVRLKLSKSNENIRNVILDTRELKITRVISSDDGKDLKFTVGETVSSIGAKLEIILPEESNLNPTIVIEYRTSPEASALQWLRPEQTSGKKQPYLFSQCQAIHCRSMIPCQDTPGIKTPYTANITAPSELTVLMSAVREDNTEVSTDSSKRVHRFVQDIPVPSYLIAIVVGALESRVVGPRSRVWSEKETIEAAAFEFNKTEEMLKTAEDLLGPYVWGVYDLLVLPPSFPYGGMENPCLTFLTPTLLAGDQSLTLVVAHEIAHSWTGNLVTNSNWEHFWLNEGHTVFVERKIAGRIGGGEPFRHFTANGGWKELRYRVGVFGDTHPHTHLVPDLKGIDPDDAFSTIPYEKGSNLLMYLEEQLGGPSVFEPFLRSYIEKFKFKSLTTDDWKNYLYSYFSDKKSLLDKVDWNGWLYSPGMPPTKAKYDTSLAEMCANLADQWAETSDDKLSSFKNDDLSQFTSQQVEEFLAQLLEKPPLSLKKYEKMNVLYNLNAVKNCEIRFRWLRLGLLAGSEDAVNRSIEFVNEQGRMKYLRPIYRDLYNLEKFRDLAINNFKKTCSSMHSIAATMCGKDLKLK